MERNLAAEAIALTLGVRLRMKLISGDKIMQISKTRNFRTEIPRFSANKNYFIGRGHKVHILYVF